jgi:hypothetical protein
VDGCMYARMYLSIYQSINWRLHDAEVWRYELSVVVHKHSDVSRADQR